MISLNNNLYRRRGVLLLALNVLILGVLWKWSNNCTTVNNNNDNNSNNTPYHLTVRGSQRLHVRSKNDVDPSVLITIGTRPEAIKMAPIYHEFLRVGHIAPYVCITGQHPALMESFLLELNVTVDVHLVTFRKYQSTGKLMANILETSSAMLELFNPNLVLVQGDTTSAYAMALASFLLQINVGHVEAGLRTYDLQSPFPGMCKTSPVF